MSLVKKHYFQEKHPDQPLPIPENGKEKKKKTRTHQEMYKIPKAAW